MRKLIIVNAKEINIFDSNILINSLASLIKNKYIKKINLSQKFASSLKENIIADYHPEINSNELR